LLALSCEAVPEVDFPLEGGTDGSSSEAGRDGADETGDGAGDAGCPGTPTPPAQCCGTIPCYGNECANLCSTCQLKCGQLQYCCAKNMACHDITGGVNCPP
jgi:hypothetical protein